jgi:voltage-gated potassium channel
VFSLVDLMGPESFAGLHGREAAEAAGVAGPLIDSRLIYFSFVSLTTLGYGDITPQTALAERLSALEAIMGQFYIAVVVAYLVSSYFAQRRAPGKPDA